MNSKRGKTNMGKEYIDEILRYEPKVRAFVDGTFDKTNVLDTIKNQNKNLPLSGVLLGVKDIINVDKFPTRCGSELPSSLFDGPQASCVTRLLKAGAVMVGKTVTAEFAASDPGPTRNPRNLSYSPGGSSSGSAAAVAAGFCDIALGTQTSGSVIRPAGYCGTFGYKPSFGRIASDGVLPFSKSMDHIGLLAKDMPTMAATLPILVDDWKNNKVGAQNGKPVIGIPKGTYIDLASKNVREQYEGVITKISAIGFVIKPINLTDDIIGLNDAHDLIANAELYQIHKFWLKNYRHLYKPKSLDALDFGKKISSEVLAENLLRAQKVQLHMQKLMEEQQIDIWLAPVAPDLAPRGISSTGDFRMNAVWSLTGLPVITFPTGTDHRNLPYGIQIIGRFGLDERLLDFSSELNRHIGVGSLPLAWDRH